MPRGPSRLNQLRRNFFRSFFARFFARRRKTRRQNEKPAHAAGIRQLCRLEALERAKGLEPSTPTLARSCSTTELHPHPNIGGDHAPTTAELCQMPPPNATARATS